MSSLHFLQIECEQPNCGSRYPDAPKPCVPKGTQVRDGAVAGVIALRAEAASHGWETKRHTKGRDLCPPCRISEIQRQYGWAFEDKKDAEVSA